MTQVNENENVQVEEVQTEKVVETTPSNEEVNPKGPRRQVRGNRKNFSQREVKEFEERVVQINRISKTVKGGRRMRFSALVVVGDKKGRVGFGHAKANEVPDAIKKALEAAKKSVFKVSLVNEGKTIPHPIIGQFGAANIVLKPASEGTGVVAGGAVRAILELAGLQDVIAKCIGSRTPINATRATIKALKDLRTVEQIAKTRGLDVKGLR